MAKQTITLQLEASTLVADLYEPPLPCLAPPLLLIHGWGGSGRYWRPAIERLSGRFRFIVPDLPGVGRSLPVRRPLDMFGHAVALEHLLGALGVERVHLVGHSMGGGIAILLAARRPDLVDRLVLTSISLFRNEAERAFFSTMTEVAGLFMRFRAPWMADIPFLAHQSAGRFFYQVPDDPALLRAAFLDYLLMDHATAVASARSAGDPAINAAARQVQAPTLLVVSHEDRLMPDSNVPYTLATIPNARVHWIERCGHLPMIERADEYVAVVQAFLDDPTRAVLDPAAVMQEL